MKFKVALYQTAEGFTVFCPGLQGCITEADSPEEALSNAQIAIREYMEASWIEMKEEIERDSQDSHVISVRMDDVEVNLDGVEEAEADQVATLTEIMPVLPGINHPKEDERGAYEIQSGAL